ncbi:BCD family MFS transporter [Maricaulaceae bacterium MS644]
MTGARTQSTSSADRGYLSWIEIVRLGLVQAALGSIVVLTTSTLNRVMVVELALPAMLPGALVGLHYAVQLTRPRWGHGSDMGGARTPWIIAGMAVLAMGGVLAAVATAWTATSPIAGIALAVFAFVMIGGGVGAAGTSLLALLATDVAPERRAPAASITWIMMIFGFAVTAGVAGGQLDPFTLTRFVAVTAAVSAIAFALCVVAVLGVERSGQARRARRAEAGPAAPKTNFKQAMKEVWGEPKARRFTIFVFVSMLAYSSQDMILEPFSGLVFNLTPGQSTQLAGVQNAGVLLGMIGVAVLGARLSGSRFGRRQAWVIGGCVASSLALLGLAAASLVGPGWPLGLSVFLLGLSNGAFAVAAIGAMMGLAGADGPGREGVRIGLWGAAQAIAFGVGGFLGAAAIDAARALFADATVAFGLVFAIEAALFLVAARLALGVEETETQTQSIPSLAGGAS